MSTNNNASQTLFRFVSLRNPQLTETKEKNLGFIHRPKGISGIFDTVVAAKPARASKFGEMAKAASGFSNSGFETEKKIEDGDFGKLLTIGRKLAKKEKLQNDEWGYVKDYYQSLIDTNKELNANGIKIFSLLWNNLIYLIVSQGDFYIKEAVSHILMALHLGFASGLDLADKEIVKVNGDKPLEKAMNSKIVLPKSLFVQEEFNAVSTSIASRSSSEISEQVLSTKAIQRLEAEAKTGLVVSKALNRKEALEKLNSELEKLQKKYYKSSYQAYQNEYPKYLEKNRERIDEYQKRKEEIESRITPETTEEEKARLYASISEFKVPPFEFSYKNEINLEDLQAQLSPESFDSFIELFSEFDSEKVSEAAAREKAQILSDDTLRIGDQDVVLDDSIQTYSDAMNRVQNNISESVQTALENSPLPQQQYVNVGGASIPVVQSTNRTPMAYSFFAHTSFRLSGTGGFVNFSFEVEDVSWSVASARIIANTDVVGAFEENYANIPVIDNKITLPTSLVNKFQSSLNFRIEIIFDNGSEAYGDIGQQFTKGDLSLTGMLTLKRAVENTEQTEIVQQRKNFGIKRLGVADYLKVVQSSHAYVPGDVTHIENVMAREFKQKSTRRLRRSENQTTTSKSTEKETLTDTTSTTRHDMQSEVANVIQQDLSAEAHFNYGTGKSYQIGGSFAAHNAKENSVRQAVTEAQEITNRASDKLLTKISEERIEKIIEEYEENNAHGFDNRNGDKHVVGVYRWVDQKYKNQIYNYGIRTMFEFMIPEPARLHRLALSVAKAQVLTAPVDPRTAPDKVWTMPTPKAATKEQIQHWADIYGVTLTDLPEQKKQHVIGLNWFKLGGDGGLRILMLDFPQNYAAKSVRVNYGYEYGYMKVSNFTGGKINLPYVGRGSIDSNYSVGGLNITGSYPYEYQGVGVDSFNVSFVFECELSDDYMLVWKTENFNAIIKAYEEAYAKFQEEQAKLDEEQKKKEEEQKSKMGQFYRYMEHDVLKHNCIAYLLQDYLITLGQSFTEGDKMENFKVNLGEDLDKYTALAKFLEQAFEWTIMDYTFYPYYWANRQQWQEMYVSDSVDPLFRSFLQSGMARVVVTVRPGFEDAVQFFLETGIVWNGGQVPVIGDPMYLSIVDEMRQPLGLKQGKAWITRMPTTLTILQEDSAGLKTKTALPFTAEKPEEFENPEEVVTASEFAITGAQLNSGAHRFIENIDIKDGNLQLTTDDDPRKIVAQISMQSIKNNLP